MWEKTVLSEERIRWAWSDAYQKGESVRGRERAIAKAQAEKTGPIAHAAGKADGRRELIEWGNGICEGHEHWGNTYVTRGTKRHYCLACRETLLKELE